MKQTRSKSLQDWQSAEVVDNAERLKREIEAASERKRIAADLEINTFQVWKNGKLEFETGYENEAIKTAEKIKATVVRCIEGAGIEQVYPIPEYKQ
jgi:hypothetical protein